MTINVPFQILAEASDPEGAALTYVWTQVYGPAPAVFEDATVLQPIVTASQIGAYRFRLTASDGKASGRADVSVIVRGSGGERLEYLDLDTPTKILATSADPDEYRPPDSLDYLWSQFSGPDGIEFDDVQLLEPTVTLSDVGNYIVGVQAFDGLDYAYDEITLSTVCPAGTLSVIWSNTFDSQAPGFMQNFVGQCWGAGSIYVQDAVAWDSFDGYAAGDTEAVDDPVSGGITMTEGAVFLWFLESYAFDTFNGYPEGPAEAVNLGQIRAGSAQGFTSLGPGTVYLPS